MARGFRIMALLCAALGACSASSSSERQLSSGAARVALSSTLSVDKVDPVLDEVTIVAREHPLVEVETKELALLVKQQTHSLGSVSVGEPNRGWLLNAVQMPEDERWHLVAPERAWGTRETIEFLKRAVEALHRQYPDAPRVLIGDMSGERGGYIRPHRSHQSGRDVDIGYIYADGAKWYTRATSLNFDRERTWALVKSLIAETDVEYIFMAGYVQSMLREYAERVEPNAEWLDQVFQHPGRRHTLIRNTWGHATHMHVRFYNNQACETARLTFKELTANRRRLALR